MNISLPSIDFPFWLITATIASGVIILTDKVYCHYYHSNVSGCTDTNYLPKLVDYSKSFFPVLLFVLLLRSFLFEPFKVPTGSLEPTVLPGDFIVSNKYAYGLRMPVWGKKLISIGLPKNGDIAIFRTPVDRKTWMVKRVIGVPGDKIDYVDKQLTVNGIAAKYTSLGESSDTNDGKFYLKVKVAEEELFGIKHKIFMRDRDYSPDFHLVVPEGMYFMMGDNRDNSDDSRYWGFVPENNLEGKAVLIWLSWDQFNWRNFRWSRFGTWLNN